jgi:hypothetical protein
MINLRHGTEAKRFGDSLALVGTFLDGNDGRRGSVLRVGCSLRLDQQKTIPADRFDRHADGR